MIPLSDDRIGDASRDKWIAFWNAAFQAGYIDPSEHSEGLDKLLGAKTCTEISQVISVLASEDRSDWEKLWERRRDAGIARKPGIAECEADYQPRKQRDGLTITLWIAGVSFSALMGLMIALAIMFPAMPHH